MTKKQFFFFTYSSASFSVKDLIITSQLSFKIFAILCFIITFLLSTSSTPLETDNINFFGGGSCSKSPNKLFSWSFLLDLYNEKSTNKYRRLINLVIDLSYQNKNLTVLKFLFLF